MKQMAPYKLLIVMAKQNVKKKSCNRMKVANQKWTPTSAPTKPSTANRRDKTPRLPNMKQSTYRSKPVSSYDTVLSTSSGAIVSITITSSQGLAHGKYRGVKVDPSKCGLGKVSNMDCTLSN